MECLSEETVQVCRLADEAKTGLSILLRSLTVEELAVGIEIDSSELVAALPWVHLCPDIDMMVHKLLKFTFLSIQRSTRELVYEDCTEGFYDSNLQIVLTLVLTSDMFG